MTLQDTAETSGMSTAELPAADRLASWESYCKKFMVDLTCSTFEPEGLVARQTNLRVGEVRMADIVGNAHVVERAPGLVRRNPKGSVFVSTMLEGEAFFYSASGCLRVGAGDVVVYDSDQPYLFGFSRSMRQILVDIPYGVLDARAPRERLAAPLQITDGVSGPSGLVARTLSRVVRQTMAELPAVGRTGLAERIVDLVQALTAARVAPGSAAHLLAATTYVAERLDDPRLSLDTVSRAVGVSGRHLNRAFAGLETTVTRYIQDQRLERARADLLRSSDDRVADVAHRYGFASQAHFARLFRERFGCAPSEARHAPLVSGTGKSDVRDGEASGLLAFSNG